MNYQKVGMNEDDSFVMIVENDETNYPDLNCVMKRGATSSKHEHQNASNRHSYSQSLRDKVKWTWKCWLPALISDLCFANVVKRFSIILILVCLIIFVIIVLFGEPIHVVQLMRQNPNIPVTNQHKKINIPDNVKTFMTIKLDSPHGELSQQILEDLNKNLGPIKHLDGVKMEQDGRLNKQYKKELFLGNPEDVENATIEEVSQTLEDIFHKVDIDQDGTIDVYELEDWIRQKVQEHLNENTEENEKLFLFLDKNKSGKVAWSEYFKEFLISKGHSAAEAEKHTEDYESIHMDNREKDQLIRQKFRWSAADREPDDNQLTMAEFRDFRHPEQSSIMLDHVVSDILNNLDRDKDGFLNEYEFIAHPEGEMGGVTNDVGVASVGDLAKLDKRWREERRLEFRQIVDSDKDGIVTKEELMKYVDPMNPSHARNEARHLMELADTNRDRSLTLDEILNNKELILGSKMVDPAKNFHDEFR